MPVSSSGAYGSMSLSPDAYLKLFIEQLKRQDPTQPMDPGQMMSQLAQMSTVQQLDQLNATFASAFRGEQLGLAKDLIGCEVTYRSGDEAGIGIVDKAIMRNDVVGVTIDGEFVPLDDVRGVLRTAAAVSADATADATVN